MTSTAVSPGWTEDERGLQEPTHSLGFQKRPNSTTFTYSEHYFTPFGLLKGYVTSQCDEEEQILGQQE